MQTYLDEYNAPPPVAMTNDNPSNNLPLLQILAAPVGSAPSPLTAGAEGYVPRQWLEMNPSLKDAWGHPLHILVTATNASGVRVGTQLVGKPFVIWSDGENGVNEFGTGDDVASWKLKPPPQPRP
jgi:hypothetical protein